MPSELSKEDLIKAANKGVKEHLDSQARFHYLVGGYSPSEAIQKGVESAFKQFLDENKSAIIEAIAKQKV